MDDLIKIAKSYLGAGLSVIPTQSDKRPACPWKAFTARPPSEREIDVNFVRAAGIGIVCGRVSGNLELLDFDDGGSAFEPWFAQVPPYLRGKLVVEKSPSGGRHVYYRVGESDGDRVESGVVPGNRKLAMKADGHVLIETRGEGGYVKCAPSAGYSLVQGDFLHVPTVSPFEQGLMIDAAKALDEKDPAGTPATGSLSNVHQPITAIELTDHGTPWDDFNERGDIAALLEAHGWKRTGGPSDNEHWERPGKDERSTSATWNGAVFFVFSSNAPGFESSKGYNKFQVFAALECGGDVKWAARRLRNMGYGGSAVGGSPAGSRAPIVQPTAVDEPVAGGASSDAFVDPGEVPEDLLHVPGFVSSLAAYTMRIAPYPNQVLSFAGALAMLAHLTGRNFANERNLRTNLYLVALADSGVGKDILRKVNMNLATELGLMPTMADRFASAEGLEDSLLLHPASFFQVDEIDTLFAALQDKKDSSNERIYGALLQFATSADTTYSMRKKAIQQTGGKSGRFDKLRAEGIRSPHLTLLGTAIPKYLYSALTERTTENGLLSRCLIVEAGPRGKAGDPHAESFPEDVLATGRHFASLGGFTGVDLENLEAPPNVPPDPYIVTEDETARTAHVALVEECESLYDAAKTTAEKALWTRGAEKSDRLALLYALSENPREPIITAAAVDWGWRLVKHLTARMLYQAGEYIHDNEFDALRQKAIRYLRDYGTNGTLPHGRLLRYLHIDSDTFRKVIETLLESELIVATPLTRGGNAYTLVQSSQNVHNVQ